MTIKKACKVLGVAKSGYYEFLGRPKSRTRIEREAMEPFIIDIFNQNMGRYGARRISAELKRQGIYASHKRVAKILTTLGLQAKGCTRRYRRKKPVSDSGENLLNREFTIRKKNRTWVGDITYIATKEGFLYLSVFMDLFSRKIVGWSTSSRINENLTVAALDQGVGRESPDVGLCIHTDRGSQYTSRRFEAALIARGFIHSYSRKGNPYDNAVMESFYRTLKREMPVAGRFDSRIDARQEVFKFIELYYNTRRSHSTIGNMSPVEYERLFEHKCDSLCPVS